MARASQLNKLRMASSSSWALRKVRMMLEASRTLCQLTCLFCVLLLSSLSYSLRTLSMIGSIGRSRKHLASLQNVCRHDVTFVGVAIQNIMWWHSFQQRRSQKLFSAKKMQVVAIIIIEPIVKRNSSTDDGGRNVWTLLVEWAVLQFSNLWVSD